METEQARASTPSGLLTACDIIIAPQAAFARLRVVPTWGWAFLIATVVGAIAAVLIGPAIGHGLAVEMPSKLTATPQFAALPPDQRAAMLAQQVGIAQTVARFSFVFVPIGLLVGALVQSVVMLLANAIAKGDGTLKTFWALAMNVSIVTSGVGSVVLAVIVLVHGVNTYNSTAAVAGSLPSLALFAPSGSRALTAFLSALNVFAVWGAVLLWLGMTISARIPRIAAAITATLLLFAAGLFPLVGALTEK